LLFKLDCPQDCCNKYRHKKHRQRHRRNTEGAMLFQKLVRPKPWPNQQAAQLQEQIKRQEAPIAEPASGKEMTGATIPGTEQSVIQPKS
jgi:hypothetical protein